MDFKKKVAKLGEFNEFVFEDLILSINANFSVVKIAFGLIRNAKGLEFSDGCQLHGTNLSSMLHEEYLDK